MPSSILPELHDLEREVMEEVWSRQEATVRVVHEALNQRFRQQRAYTTVMTVMQRLHEKELLKRRQEGRGHVYLPAMDRDEYFDRRARDQVGALLDEYGELALVHFARHMEDLDPKRRRKLRELARRG